MPKPFRFIDRKTGDVLSIRGTAELVREPGVMALAVQLAEALLENEGVKELRTDADFQRGMQHLQRAYGHIFGEEFVARVHNLLLDRYIIQYSDYLVPAQQA